MGFKFFFSSKTLVGRRGCTAGCGRGRDGDAGGGRGRGQRRASEAHSPGFGPGPSSKPGLSSIWMSPGSNPSSQTPPKETPGPGKRHKPVTRYLEVLQLVPMYNQPAVPKPRHPSIGRFSRRHSNSWPQVSQQVFPHARDPSPH